MGMRTAVSKAPDIWRKVGYVITTGAAYFVLVLALAVSADAIMRYAFNKPLLGVLESTSLVMAYIVFLSLSYTLAIGGHVRVTLFLRRMGIRSRLWAETLDCLLGLFFFGSLAYYSWWFFWSSFLVKEIMPAIVSLPFYVGKFAMPVGMFMMFIQFLLQLIAVWVNPQSTLSSESKA
ncbi:TRAP transporter small permease subunit [Chloroflexota bacterium]